jgi:hypothetical protein
MIFNEKRTRTDVEMKIYISYLEIYNDQGYDLLDPSHEVTALEDLPKVSMLEDEHGNFHLKNLSVHPVGTEVEALDLLFYGDTNRAIAETPMNLVCHPHPLSFLQSSLSPPSRPPRGLIVSSLFRLNSATIVQIRSGGRSCTWLISLEVKEWGKLTPRGRCSQRQSLSTARSSISRWSL